MNRGPIDYAKLGPSPELVFGPEQELQAEQMIDRAHRLLKELKEEKTMHYRNGREAKNGDKLVSLGNDGQINAFGVLHSATPGNDYCNGSIAIIQSNPFGACLCDCLHIDDVAEILKEKGLDKRSAGK